MAPDVRLSSRPPGEASCPYCRTNLETGETARTCVQCGAPYHEACTAEIPRCGILGCGGGFSRPETWNQDAYTLSERIRRAIRKPHVTVLHPGIEPEEDGDWVHQLRRSRPSTRETTGPRHAVGQHPGPKFWVGFTGVVGGVVVIYQLNPQLVEAAGSLLLIVSVMALLAWATSGD